MSCNPRPEGQMLSEECIEGIVGWYAVNGKRYPWTAGGRERPDAYGVWVSEVMLQQTTVAAAAPRYRRWMERYPTVESLADSSEDDVLREWEGLGYYSRARNLFSAAGEVRRLYGGRLPGEPERLRALPGVGEYIAAAVASIAFDYPAAAVEANGRRIAQRLAASEKWNRDLEGAFRGAVEAAMKRSRPGTVNAAVMQFGQRVCLPRSPRCGECPVDQNCRARLMGIADRIPARRREEITQKTTNIAVLINRKQLWLEKRREGIGRGLWVFPARSEVRDIQRWRAGAELPRQVHLYTRYRDELRPQLYEPAAPKADRQADQQAPTGNSAWHTMEELAGAAMPTAHRRIADDIVNRL